MSEGPPFPKRRSKYRNGVFPKKKRGRWKTAGIVKDLKKKTSKEMGNRWGFTVSPGFGNHAELESSITIMR